MDVRQLEIVGVVADAGSFTAAARRLHVSQSAVSRQVLLLEEELGEPVFVRLGRRVRLTAAGQSLLQLSRRVLRDIHDTTSAIVEHHRQLEGTIHLAGGMTVCLHVFPAMLKDFRRRHPRIEVRLATGGTPHLLARIRSGEIDIGLLTLPVDGAEFEQVPVMREELLVAMPPKHPLATRRSILPRDLSEQPCVLFERGSSTRRVIDDMMAREHINPRIVMETENVEIIKALVTIGMGLGIVPYQAAVREIRAGVLHCARIDGVALVRETGWVYLKGRRVPRIARQMFDALTRTVPKLRLAPRTISTRPPTTRRPPPAPGPRRAAG